MGHQQHGEPPLHPQVLQDLPARTEIRLDAELSAEDALRFTLTAGITGIQGKQPHGKEQAEKPGT